MHCHNHQLTVLHTHNSIWTSDGFRSREIRADNEGAYYPLNQFGHIRIDQVSIRSNVTGRTDFSTTNFKFDHADKFNDETNSFDETNVIIPLDAYKTKINVPPLKRNLCFQRIAY